MNQIPLVSKITERGQITLPKRVRDALFFKGALAVEFTEQVGTVVIRPIMRAQQADEHFSLLDHTMHNWSKTENDDLFDFR